MFCNYNLEDFFILIKLKSCLTHSLLIIYVKMFKLLKSETLNPIFDVENHIRDIDSTLFFIIKRIDVYCYK